MSRSPPPTSQPQHHIPTTTRPEDKFFWDENKRKEFLAHCCQHLDKLTYRKETEFYENRRREYNQILSGQEAHVKANPKQTVERWMQQRKDEVARCQSNNEAPRHTEETELLDKLIEHTMAIDKVKMERKREVSEKNKFHHRYANYPNQLSYRLPPTVTAVGNQGSGLGGISSGGITTPGAVPGGALIPANHGVGSDLEEVLESDAPAIKKRKLKDNAQNLVYQISQDMSSLSGAFERLVDIFYELNKPEEGTSPAAAPDVPADEGQNEANEHLSHDGGSHADTHEEVRVETTHDDDEHEKVSDHHNHNNNNNNNSEEGDGIILKLASRVAELDEYVRTAQKNMEQRILQLESSKQSDDLNAKLNQDM